MDFALWNLAALAAFFIKGLCGFANTLVFTTILSFSPAINRNISPVELLLGYPTNLILAWRERRAIRWRVCLPLAGLVMAGSVPGALLLRGADSGRLLNGRRVKQAVVVMLMLSGGALLFNNL